MSSLRHRLRRSCAFCRARKIKCSNDTICEACRRQGADCIYDFETTRSKVPNNAQDRRTPPGSRTACSWDRSSSFDDPDQMSDSESVAAALENSFRGWDLPQRENRARLSEARSSSSSSPTTPELNHSPSTFSHDFYTQVPSKLGNTGGVSLPNIAQDLVEVVTRRFRAGGGSSQDEQPSLGTASLANDEDQTMFDEITQSPSDANIPLELNRRQQTQLIDVWYSTHPLSFTVSKTLLLRELRDGVYDEALLAVILGDASLSTGHESRGRSLLAWATSQFQLRPVRGNQPIQDGVVLADEPTHVLSGMSTRIFHSISTVQTLILLGWNALTSGSIRRASCYVGLAGQMVARLKEQISTSADPKASSRINGIDVFEVERELIEHIYWTTHAICLWTFVQTGKQHFAPSLSKTQAPILLPSSEDLSVVLGLDKISENFNTLHAQTAAIRVAWPLAHIACIVSDICISYSADTHSTQRQTTSSAMTPSQQLQDPFRQILVDRVYPEVTRTLTRHVEEFDYETNPSVSGTIVLLAYHILAIHFLFPAQEDDDFQPQVVDQFCVSAQDILKGVSFLKIAQPGSPTEDRCLQTLLRRLLALALVTCSAALTSIVQHRGTLDEDDASALKSLATQLYESTKSASLAQSKPLRMAKKDLKAVLRLLEQDASQISVAVPSQLTAMPMALGHISPGLVDQRSAEFEAMMTGRSMPVVPSSPHRTGPASITSASPSSSEHLSTASTAVLDMNIPLFSPQERKSKDSPQLSTMSMPPSALTVTTSHGVFSPADVFKSSWQPMSSDELFENARLMTFDASSFPPPNSTNAAPGVSTAGGSDAAGLQQSASWLPQMSAGMMMNLDMTPGMSLAELPTTKSESSDQESWYMNSMAMGE